MLVPLKTAIPRDSRYFFCQESLHVASSNVSWTVKEASSVALKALLAEAVAAPEADAPEELALDAADTLEALALASPPQTAFSGPPL
jgi:hypothetical protein